MSTASAEHRQFEHERFSVRDISAQYDAPTFDLIFRDKKHCVERCSDSVWSSFEQASVAAEELEQAYRRSVHWCVLKPL
ncbi:hypothetical protein [Pseudomonas fluorescens]|uniref:Uncharacterized protein n=2 Tax=Pseudomonas fluorescens TaxID=294 RepID=A0ABY1TCA3_PSEFL|nr:hypothetical protein [Pseudomonas fluorescens]MCI4604641.1 hypothetical protein [Pseudomonas fluorescens]PQA98980.1 hypothetical protein B0A76_20400 [Pseudomonas fluorescens]RFP93198.1 hypothetical protein D0N73_27595 [Pseudomonas fluorescens]RMO70880.1 hypothetical protein ALQ35_200077 [Pseudomonas fluorescens]SNY10061.1 hypothetical protein SAMN04488487_3043 [Pseudomonas fluorescens]